MSAAPKNAGSDLFDDDINIPVDSAVQRAPKAPTSVVQTVAPPATVAPASNANTSTGSTAAMSSLRAKLSAAAAVEYRPSQATYTSYVPSQSASDSAKPSFGEDDFDPNNFNPLTGSGAFPPELDLGDDEDVPSDPESDDVMSDDDTRDLCSNPCIKCGAVPSYVVYELCANCLDQIGPQ